MTVIRNCLFAWRTVWDAWPLGAVAYPLVIIGIAVTGGPLTAIAVGEIVDHGAFPWVLAPLATLLFVVASGLVTGTVQNRVNYVARHALRRRLLAAAVGAPGLEHLENPSFADRMFVARSRAWATMIVFRELPGVVAKALVTVVSLVLVGWIHPLLALTTAGAGVAGVLEARAARTQVAAVDRSAPGQRLAARLAQLATSAEGAKEVRMFGIGSYLVDQHRRITDDLIADLRRTRYRHVLAVGSAAAARGAALAAGVLWLLHLIDAGSVDAGQVAMGMVLLIGGVESVGALSAQTAMVVEWSSYSTPLRELLRYESPVTSSSEDAPAPSRMTEGIHVDGVWFTYPGSAVPALRNLALHLEPGTTVAIVGENGAGKSTLVKLLARLYDPSEGRVAIDGQDLRSLDVRAWRTTTTGAFQDFLQPHVTVRDAIGIGRVDRIDDLDTVRRAAERAHADRLVARLRDGYDTQLGTEFPGGVELSTGQWQLLALARASMQDEPLLVVLDEPTASLDAGTEHDVFERFVQLSERARRRGAVTVLVSHRFSTVRVADTIVVMEAGTVVDAGPHPVLMERCLLYRELYDLQASTFR